MRTTDAHVANLTRVNKPENDDPSLLDPIEGLADHRVA
jgi:hypothetical protein